MEFGTGSRTILKNEMKLHFDAISVNEAFARVAVAAFVAPLNPTMEELSDIKTAVSEAVTNAIIHGYDEEFSGKDQDVCPQVYLQCRISEDVLYVEVEDKGKGIEDIDRAMEPLFTTKPEMDRSGMGFAFMEAFMDDLEVISAPFQGTLVRMQKKLGTIPWIRQEDEKMVDNSVLIKKARAGEKEAREVLIEQNLGLVRHIVKRFLGRGYEAEDLFQIGVIGLIKAIDKFDTEYDVKFSTYAVPLITGEIKRFIRDDGMIKVSRNLKENGIKIKMAREKLAGKYGREPSIDEVAKEAFLTVEEVVLAMEANVQVESIYKSVYQSDGNELFMVDQLADESGNAHEEVLNHLLVNQLLNGLGKEEQKLIILRYYQDKTQMEVAKVLGISQVQVSRLEKKILLGMRQKMKGDV